MLDALPTTGLTIHRGVLEAAGRAMRLAARVPGPCRSLADQVIRAAGSVPANLAEGHGRSGRDRLHFWRIASASAEEVDTHLRLLVHARAVNVEHATAALQLFDEVRAMTWRLLHLRPECPAGRRVEIRTGDPGSGQPQRQPSATANSDTKRQSRSGCPGSTRPSCRALSVRVARRNALLKYIEID